MPPQGVPSALRVPTASLASNCFWGARGHRHENFRGEMFEVALVELRALFLLRDGCPLRAIGFGWQHLGQENFRGEILRCGVVLVQLGALLGLRDVMPTKSRRERRR